MPVRTSESRVTRTSLTKNTMSKPSLRSASRASSSSRSSLSDISDDEQSDSASASIIADAVRRARSSSRLSANKRKRVVSLSVSDIHDIIEEEDEDEGREEGDDDMDDFDADNASSESDDNSGEFTPSSSRRQSKGRRISTPVLKKARTTKTKSVKSSQPQNNSVGNEDEDNALFGALKDSDTALDELAVDWIQSYEKDRSSSLEELVNLILKACGCEVRITKYDIEDQDSAAETLAQIQEAVKQKQLADYPMVSKKPEFKKFRNHMIEFFSNLIQKAVEREIIYEDESLIESIQVWITTMSSSPLRSFRLTSTTVALSVMTSLCESVASLTKTSNRTTKLLENEQKKKSVNQDKLNKLQSTMDNYAIKIDALTSLIHDHFDTIFLHRYRDIDAKIRTECIKELGKWMEILPDIFFEGQYLRYMGWILSDANGPTRLEVIKGLSKLYKDNYFVGGLRQFTERFRPRLVEMAIRDVDHNVRIATVGLLESIRSIGFLEQEDIDEVCSLIFDTNSRVRKSVVAFFMANITEMVEERLSALGEEAEGYFSQEDSDDDSDEYADLHKEITAKRSWMTIKCIAEVLESYNDSALTQNTVSTSRLRALVTRHSESRYSIAGKALWEFSSNLPEWTEIIKFSVVDLSISESNKSQIPVSVSRTLELNTHQVLILLDLGLGALQTALTKADSDAPKKMKKQKDQGSAGIEVSRKLFIYIPLMMKMFGSDPELACEVLRFHKFMDLSIYQQLRQKHSYEELFDSICKVFVKFDDISLSQEFIQVLLHAQENQFLSDIIEPKISEIQDQILSLACDTISAYSDLSTDLLNKKTTAILSNAVEKLNCLSSVTNCSDLWTQKLRGSEFTFIDVLCSLLQRVDSPEMDEIDVLTASISALRFFVMWKVKQSVDTRSTVNLHNVQSSLELTVDRFEGIIMSDADINLRRVAACALLDIMVSLNVLTKRESVEYDEISTALQPTSQRAILKIFQVCENSYAKLAKIKLQSKKVNNSANEEEEDNDELESSSEEEEEEDGLEINEIEKRERVTESDNSAKIESELKLCELTGKMVIGVLSGSLSVGIVSRLRRNAKVLGATYDRIVSELSPLQDKQKESLTAEIS
ncbi:STAG domain-containing protein [Dipodascopsis uninucleata]